LIACHNPRLPAGRRRPGPVRFHVCCKELQEPSPILDPASCGGVVFVEIGRKANKCIIGMMSVKQALLHDPDSRGIIEELRLQTLVRRANALEQGSSKMAGAHDMI